MNRLRLPSVVIGGLALAAFTPAEAAQQTDAAAKEQTDAAGKKEGTVTTENHAWGGYHWKHSGTPYTRDLGDNVGASATANWDPYLRTTAGAVSDTFNDWQLPYETWDGYTYTAMLSTPIVAGGTTAKRCSPATGKAEVCNARYGNSGWLGVAGISVTSDGHITRGYAKMNDTYFDSSKYNTRAWRNLVMCQEVGHLFGLAHQNESYNTANTGSCMDYTNDPDGGADGVSADDPSNEYPNRHDYEQLQAIYGSGHSSHSSTQTANTSTDDVPEDEPGNDPKDWGTEVWRDKDGRASVFEKQLDDKGSKKVTHVLWTLERAEKLQGKNKHQDEH
jgi:hypothetical protein